MSKKTLGSKGPYAADGDPAPETSALLKTPETLHQDRAESANATCHSDPAPTPSDCDGAQPELQAESAASRRSTRLVVKRVAAADVYPGATGGGGNPHPSGCPHVGC